MNQVNPNKLLLSKWTAVKPQNRERHFLVTGLIRDEEGHVIEVHLEALINRRRYSMHWKELKNSQHWHMGWR